ncbi:MAG: hypothetical protein NT027_09105 [Proteobacteria bacterium]|nr:hypothetical protein [Pseudomonadota bacterium]
MKSIYRSAIILVASLVLPLTFSSCRSSSSTASMKDTAASDLSAPTKKQTKTTTDGEQCITGSQCNRVSASGKCRDFDDFTVCGKVCEITSICGHVKNRGTTLAKCSFSEDDIACGNVSCKLEDDCASKDPSGFCTIPEERVVCE